MPMPPLQPPPFKQKWTTKDGYVPAGPVQDFLLAQQQAIVTAAAPANASYLVTQSDAGLSAEVNLGGLIKGYLRQTVAAGVATIASALAVFKQASPADPIGTTSLVGKMMGLAVSVTPVFTGRLQITIVGALSSDTSGDGAKAQIRTGTGAAPANGDALTGAAQGAIVPYLAAANNQSVPVALCAIVSGLTPNVAVWIDVGLAAITGGTAAITNLGVTVLEV